ncbi:MAG: transposase [Octadecabacter sp.]
MLDGVDRETAARSSGMDRQTPRDWAHRFNAEGIEGLSDRSGKGAKPRLSPRQQAHFVAWVEAKPDPVKDGVVRWRYVDFQVRVDKEFDVKLHVLTIGKYLTKHGFRRLSVRPEHPKNDCEAQHIFKTLPHKRYSARICKGKAS